MRTRAVSGSTSGRKSLTNVSLTIATRQAPGAILLGEGAAAKNAYPEGLEELRRHHVHAGARWVGRIVGTADDLERFWPNEVPAHGHAGGNRRGRDAWKGRGPFEQLTVEGSRSPRACRGGERGTGSCSVSSWSVRKPRSTLIVLMNACAARPPPASSVSASANSSTTSTRRSRWRPPPIERPPSLIASDEVGTGGLPGGGAARERAGHRADAEREQQHGDTERDLGFRRQRVIRHQRDDRVEKHRREQRAYHAAHEREHQALDEQLPRDRAVGRAEGRAHGELAVPRAAAREEEVGDVGARDQQQEAHRGQEQPEALLRAAADEVVAERLDARAPRFGFRRVRRSTAAATAARLALAC